MEALARFGFKVSFNEFLDIFNFRILPMKVAPRSLRLLMLAEFSSF